MDAKQFSKNLTTYRRKTQFGKKHDAKIKCDDEDFLQTNQMMTLNIFKGRKVLTEADFVQLKNSIQEILWHYEYH